MRTSRKDAWAKVIRCDCQHQKVKASSEKTRPGQATCGCLMFLCVDAGALGDHKPNYSTFETLPSMKVTLRRPNTAISFAPNFVVVAGCPIAD